MTTLPSLKVLQDNNRDALLLAEAIGWLHDYRKCSEEHLQSQAPGSKTSALPRTELANRQPGLQCISLALPTVQSLSRTVADLLDDKTWSKDTLGKFLSRGHNTAHFDKQEPVGGEQNYPGTQISSAFGFEESVGTTLTVRLRGLPWGELNTLASDRQYLREQVSTLFAQTVADSRRPINEVGLWSWGSFVGALYKSALSGCLLTGIVPSAPDLQWRLLGIRVDGLGYISNVARVPDLLVRQKLLSDGLDQVRKLLEVEYPLGSEVYRDQHGSIFIMPDVPDLLRTPDDRGTTLEARIVQTFTGKVEGDLLPLVTLEQDSWWGQDPTWSKRAPTATNDKLPDIKGMLVKPVTTQADARVIEALWQVKKGNLELCPVCRLRPMKEGQEACETCMNRRGSRVQGWLKTPFNTIWIDEIADHNDRVALVVGKFGLDDWLSGDLVQTMLVKAIENNPGACVPKNPSPARLRRVWETCQRFWSETVMGTILAGQPFGGGDALRCRRVAVVPDDCKGWQENVPYDGTINGRAVSLFWRESEKRFITISNLQLGVSQARDEIGLIGEWHGRICTVSPPSKPGQTRTFTVQQVQSLNGEPIQIYAPYLSLLESPDRFLALVPAAEALEIVGKIRDEYHEQMGKVQNRLPLFLGIVFFPRKLPLMAVMDAARRMLAMDLPEETWQVECVTPQNTGSNIEIRLSLQLKRIDVTIPVKMRGNSTDDLWYPYFFVQHFADGTPDNRALRFQHDGRWLVHAKELKKDDQVAMTPSRFAYLFLESTARRFRFDPQQDVLLLDELPWLTKMWTALKESGITMTGLRNVLALLESKGAAWGRDSEEFERLACTTLQEAGLFERKDKDGNPLPDVITPQDVTSERFAHCLELYLHILKPKNWLRRLT